MKNFIYRKASSLKEAVQLLSEYQGNAKILAGGTDLLVKMKEKKLAPEVLIDLKEISKARQIKIDGCNELVIGALATIREIETSEPIRKKFKMISEAAAHLGSVQIRHRATLGGNLCNASPAAEMAPCLLSLGANARIFGSGGERQIPLEDFFQGPGQTVLRPDEVLASIQVPDLSPRAGCAYLKYGLRKAMDLPIVSAAVCLPVDEKRQHCRQIRIALGAVAPVPMRARRAEDLIRDSNIKDSLIAEAGRLASEEAQPITDIRGSAAYRREIIRTLTQKAIQQAWNEIR